MAARKPRDYVRALVSGLAEPWRSRRLMLMLQAFIDDSGTTGDTPVFVLAGYLSSEWKWEAFADAWQEVLDLPEPKPIDVFKMAEARQFRHRHSRFFGFTQQELDARLLKLVDVIDRHVEHGVVSVVPIDLYEKHFKGLFNPDALDRPYFLSFFGMMVKLTSLTQRLKLGDRIDFIFDTQGGESKSLLVSQFEQFVGIAPPEVKALIGGSIPKFEREEDFKPLQAADMLAWHARRYYYDLLGGRHPWEDSSNPYLAKLLKPQHDILHVWSEQQMIDVINVFKASNVRQWTARFNAVSMTLPDPSNPLSWL